MKNQLARLSQAGKAVFTGIKKGLKPRPAVTDWGVKLTVLNFLTVAQVIHHQVSSHTFAIQVGV